MDKTNKERITIPQDLCNRCAKCCRCIISFHSDEELEKSESEEAKLFLTFFKKYENLSDLNSENREFVKIIEESLQKTLVVRYCTYVNEKNECSIYEDRPDFCRTFPKNGWITTPPGCSYKGWQFEQREKQKKIIRKLKEQLLSLKIAEASDSDDGVIIKELEKKIKDKISKYKKYGADSW